MRSLVSIQSYAPEHNPDVEQYLATIPDYFNDVIDTFVVPGGAESRQAQLGAPQRRAARPHHRRGLREPSPDEAPESHRRSLETARCCKLMEPTLVSLPLGLAHWLRLILYADDMLGNLWPLNCLG